MPRPQVAVSVGVGQPTRPLDVDPGSTMEQWSQVASAEQEPALPRERRGWWMRLLYALSSGGWVVMPYGEHIAMQVLQENAERRAT